ncbi:hypothetical protein Poly59_24560 [Rubripirellula reticaptiva]|uniref:Uncharacterized protein n=1 Tax=Rubripirellula reticaptiva TaxID=2528013 RepID=A0A5C6F529_9BACT|nr:hypothetical protein Poly59_24560 [Rubripirellula reticaptiva]
MKAMRRWSSTANRKTLWIGEAIGLACPSSSNCRDGDDWTDGYTSVQSSSPMETPATRTGPNATPRRTNAISNEVRNGMMTFVFDLFRPDRRRRCLNLGLGG